MERAHAITIREDWRDTLRDARSALTKSIKQGTYHGER